MSLRLDHSEVSAAFPFADRSDWLLLAVKRARLLGAVAIASAFVLTAISFLLPSEYTATTRLLPPQQNQSLAMMFMAQSTNSPLASVAQKELGIKNPADIYVGLLNSRSILDGLIDEFGLMRMYNAKGREDARERLVSRTQIQLTKEGLISIAVEDRDPHQAAELANGYAEQLRRTTQRLAMGEAAQRRVFFEEQVQEARQELQSAEVRLTAIQQRTGILQVDAQAQTLIEAAANLRAQIAVGEVQLKAIRNFGTDANPEVVQQQTKLKAWKEELGRLESPATGDALFSKGRAPIQAQEYANAMREVRYREVVLEMLLRQSEAAKLDEAKEATIIQVVDTAMPPEKRSSPKRGAIISLGSFLAVLLTFQVLRLRQHFYNSPEWQLRWSQIVAGWRAR